MAAILAKHTGQKVEIKVAPSKSSPAKPPEVKWRKLTPDSIECVVTGRVILRAQDSSSPPNDIYIVFSGASSKGATAQVLARFRSAQDAKDYCRHLAKEAK
jgi:hypothetical protein